MPHFIIDCSENILSQKPPTEIIQTVYKAARESGLFAQEGKGGIKVRVRSYSHYTTVDSSDDFIHVFGHIMEGRNTSQKKSLSHEVVAQLCKMFPKLSIVSMNISEFEKASYMNLGMLSDDFNSGT